MKIYNDSELSRILRGLIEKFEDETVEFKKAKNNLDFNEIGQYFSALSNEANLRGRLEGWLIFGITNEREVVGTEYRLTNLQNLKKEIAEHTNERLTFREIYDLRYEGKRIIMFQIPPSLRGVPTMWNGAAYAREHESLCPLSLDKIDEIRSEVGMDWSKEIVEGATLDDLDPEAMRYARELFINKKANSDSSSVEENSKTRELLENMSDTSLLNKAGILIKGSITRSALLLLGRSDASYYFDNFVPRITWTLYNADGSVKAYEHFGMPFLLVVDKVYAKIRNEKYRYIAGQMTLFPEEVNQYDPDVIKEVLNNCIAHADYRMHGRINVEEFEDRIVFINEGSFIPETIEHALEEGYKPPYYRNTFLCDAMVNLYMIDTISMGIQKIYQVQKNKCFPLPTYDLENPNRVKVTLYGEILNRNYTQLLHSNEALNLQTVFLLDKVQKNQTISKEEAHVLKKQGLIEGRYPHVFVSSEIATIVGKPDDYVKTKGITDKACEELIISTLTTFPGTSRGRIADVISDYLPSFMDETQKNKKLSNLLQQMKNVNRIYASGTGKGARWYIK